MANVIVPSAVRVSPEMEVDFGPIPPCLVPIAGKVAAERIVEKYPDDTHFYIAVHEAKATVYDHFEFFPNNRVHLVDVGKTISIADTIDKVFAAHPELEDQPFILNFADTVVEDLDFSATVGDYVVIAQTIESLLSEHGYTPLLCTQSPGGTTERAGIGFPAHDAAISSTASYPMRYVFSATTAAISPVLT